MIAFLFFLYTKKNIYGRIIIGDTMEKENKNIDTEFTDIAKENLNKNYITVGILYVIVIILTIFLILGIKNQKDIVTDNISNEEQLEESLLQEQNNSSKEEVQDNNQNSNSNSNNLFDDVHSEVDNFNTTENDRLNDEMNLLDQIG